MCIHLAEKDKNFLCRKLCKRQLSTEVREYNSLTLLNKVAGSEWKPANVTAGIGFVMNGELVFRVGAESLLLQSGEMFSIASNEPYELRFTRQSEVLLFHINKGHFDFCEPILRTMKHPSGTIDKNLSARALPIAKEPNSSLKVLMEQLNGGGLCINYIDLNIMKILMEISFSGYLADLVPFFLPIFSDWGNVFRQTVLKYQNRLFSPQDYAERLCMTRQSFSRVFKQHFGVTPQQWITAGRRARVLELLATSPAEPIGQAFQSLGFNSEQELYRFIKQAFGKTASELKKGTRLEIAGKAKTMEYENRV